MRGKERGRVRKTHPPLSENAIPNSVGQIVKCLLDTGGYHS